MEQLNESRSLSGAIYATLARFWNRIIRMYGLNNYGPVIPFATKKLTSFLLVEVSIFARENSSIIILHWLLFELWDS